MKRLILALLLLLLSGVAYAQQPVNANIRCHNGTSFINCPISDGGSGGVTNNTTRITIGGEPCSGTKTAAPFAINSATTTQLIAASGSNKAYICSISIGPVSTANNVAFVEDNDAGCTSPTAGLIGGTTTGTGWQFPASGGLVNNGGNSSITVTAAVNRYVCLITSSSSVTVGVVMYVLAP